jgi:PAS domain S-box-containing protein
MIDLRKRSLASVVAATLVGAITILLGTYFLISYFTEAKNQRIILERLTWRQTQEISVAEALPVWNIDRPEIERVIEAMAQPQSIYGITVTAAGKTYGRAKNAEGQLAPWDGSAEPSGMIVYVSPIQYAGKDIGEARVVTSTKGLKADLWMLRLRLVATIVVVDLLLVLCVYFLLSRAVLRPIRTIERYAAAVSGGGHYDGPVAPPAAAELENLRHSIETMVRLLDTRYVELQDEMARRSESEERFFSIFDSVNDGILLRDRETGAFIDANRRACEMFGYTHEEMMALQAGGLSAGDDIYSPEHALEVIRSAKTTNTELNEWHARHADGHLFWVELNMRLATIGGEPLVIITGRDITQRKAMEEALRQSERMSTIGSLVAGVAHEVRNPLFGIAATLDAFEAEFRISDDMAEYMATLRHDVSRLSRLMNDLLEYGRPHEIVRNVQSIEPVIAEAVRVCAPRAKEKRVEIRPRVTGPLPRVAIDADRMLQVLKNVVENAIEFSKDGDSIMLDAHAEGNGKRSVVFAVADRGPGFRKEDLPHIFEPFFTRRTGGNGLGLAIVHKIVSDHGGDIAAENVAEGGARIEIRLPAA